VSELFVNSSPLFHKIPFPKIPTQELIGMESAEKESSKDILLLQPWVEDFYATDCRSLPMGLAYLAGSIKKSLPDQKVYLYDFFSAHKRRTITIPKEFSYLKRYYGAVEKSPSALFHNYFRFGESENDIIETIKKHTPFLIGISSLFSPYYRESLALAAICKKVFPGIPIVIGGNHASLSPETLLFHLNDEASTGYTCDYVIRGEGEESIVALIHALKTHTPVESIPNVVTRVNCEAARNLPLSPLKRQEIPFPDYCNLDLTKYTYKRKPMSFLITSRSCPHHCDFCSIHAVFGRQYTTRPIEDIISEIRHFYSKGIRHFDIEDDNFSFHQDTCAELLDKIAQLNFSDIGFSAMNGLSFHTLTPLLLQKMKTAGFTDLNLSLVSSQERLQDLSQRPRLGERFETVLDEAHSLGLNTVVYFIIGMPEQSLEDAVETLCYLAQKRCLLGPSPFYLTPKSAIHKKYRHSDVIKLASAGKNPHFSARLTALDVEKTGFSRDELYTVFRLTRVINSLKNLIDQNFTPDAEPFARAITALFKGEWETSVLKGTPPPFSPTVHVLLQKHLNTVRGYKSSASIPLLTYKTC
jgi:radical SAM superfamily enzyme YgiQ (UPF0313 family)